MKINRKIIVGAVVWFSVLLGAFAYIAPAGQSIPNDKPVIVSNPKDPVPPPGQRKKIIFKEELTIGAVEGDENYLFEKTIQPTADEKGCIYVLNGDRRRIQKYDATGKFLFNMGRQGQGPGEFQNIAAPLFDGKGRIYATDDTAGRVLFFDKENGRYQEAIKTGQNPGAVFLLPNGTYFSSTIIDEQTANTISHLFVFGIFDKYFKLQTEIHRDRSEYRPPAGGGNRVQQLAGTFSVTAFKPSLSPTATKDGRIIVANAATYEIKIFDELGKNLMIISKDTKPKPVTDAHKKFYFETDVMDFLSKYQEALALKEDIRKAITYPKFLPAYRLCHSMDNGWLFVVEDSLLESSWIDLFDNKGIYVGRFETNIPVDFLTFANGKAYTVAEIDGYKYVKRYGYSIQNY